MLAGLSGCDEESKANKSVPDTTLSKSAKDDPHWVHQSSPQAKVAVVFVHGLFGTTTGTWTNENGASFLDLIKTAPNVGSKIDVFAFGFTSNMISGGSLDVFQGAAKLEEWLNYKQVWEYDTVVFVGHSMGGLIVMQELINHPDRVGQVPLMVLYATPQEGSQASALGKIFLRNPALAQMVPDEASQFLIGLDNGWAHMPKHPQVVCAYETKSTHGIPIVKQFSATRFCDGARVAIGGADHMSIVKPDRQDHDSVVKLVNALTLVLGTDRNPRVEMPDFAVEGDKLVYTIRDPDSPAMAKLINHSALPVRYTRGIASSEKLMISPTDTPRIIQPGQVEELKFDLLRRGEWKDEYSFTLGTAIMPTRTVIVRVLDPKAQQESARKAAEGVMSDISAYLTAPENQESFKTLSADGQQQKIVEVAEQSLKTRVPGSSPEVRWVLTADTLSSMGWPALAARALRNAESESPAIVNTQSVQVLASAVSLQSGDKNIFKDHRTPDFEVPAEFKSEARFIAPDNDAAVWSELSGSLQAVPALKHYGLTLEGDLLKEQGRPVEAAAVYNRATDIRRTPELDAKIRSVKALQP
jgi:pimeloyl-ACP methyl ester carboxylesterase